MTTCARSYAEGVLLLVGGQRHSGATLVQVPGRGYPRLRKLVLDDDRSVDIVCVQREGRNQDHYEHA